MNIPKFFHLVLVVSVFSIVHCLGMEEGSKKRVRVYSHGFGEPGDREGITYPDAPGELSKACFYRVHTVRFNNSRSYENDFYPEYYYNA